MLLLKMIEFYIGNTLLIGNFNNIIMQKEEKSRDIPELRGGENL